MSEDPREEDVGSKPERMRIAFVGKGGSGKSTIAGTFARLLARTGEPVLALDSDPLPGLPYALGIPVDDQPIPDEVVVPGPEGGPRWVLHPELDARTVIERFAVIAPDGVRYLQFGNLRGHVAVLQRAQHAWSQVVRDLDPGAFHVVGDLPGGTRQPMFGWAKYADLVCVVVEPTAKSLHSARRLLSLETAAWGPRQILLVANKVDRADELSRIEERLQRPVAVAVPADPAVAAADRLGAAPLDAAAEGPFVSCVRDLVDAVTGLYPLIQEVKG